MQPMRVRILKCKGRLEHADLMLKKAGAEFIKKSPKRTRYHRLNCVLFRIADHEETTATYHWIKRNGVVNIRVDRSGWYTILQTEINKCTST